MLAISRRPSPQCRKPTRTRLYNICIVKLEVQEKCGIMLLSHKFSGCVHHYTMEDILMNRILSIFIALILLFTLAGCIKDTEVKRDSNGNVIEQIYYRKDGTVNFAVTYTYYESGAVHTKKTVNEPSSYSNGFTTIWTWAEDGKSYQETTYGSDGVISSDIFVELYDTTYENWHRRKTINYYEGEWSTTSLEERLDDGTISVADLTQDENVTRVSIYDNEWNLLSITFYDENGTMTDKEEYNIDGYDEKHTYYFEKETTYYETYHKNGSLLAKAIYSAPDVMTAYKVYDENENEVFYYDCSGTEYTLSQQFYDDGTMRLYVMQEARPIASYLFSGAQLIEERIENN